VRDTLVALDDMAVVLGIVDRGRASSPANA
jgi:hypothetical protein